MQNRLSWLGLKLFPLLQGGSRDGGTRTLQGNAPTILAGFFFLFLLSSPLALAQTLAENGVTKDRILIGFSTDLTGVSVSNAAQSRVGADLHFNQINKEGIHGRRIKVVYYDDGYEPKVAIENIKRLITHDKVFCLFQNYGAEASTQLLPLIEQYDIPFVAPIAPIERLRYPVHRNVFAVRNSTIHETEAVVRHAIREMSLKDIAIVRQDDVYGTDVFNQASKTLGQSDQKPIFDGKIPRNTNDVSAIIEPLIQSKAKAVLLAAQTQPSIALVTALAAKGFHPIYLGHTIHSTAAFYEPIAKFSPRIVFATGLPLVNEDNDVPLIKEFIKIARSNNIEPNLLNFEGYFNAKVFTEVLQRAGKNLSRNSLRTAFEGMTDVSIGGISVRYSSTSHRGHEGVYIGTFKNGKAAALK